MRRGLLALVLAGVVAGPTVASAEPTQIGGFFGPKIFSGDSALGYLPDAPAHPTLHNSVQFGGRFGKPFGYIWLVPELEVSFVPTETTDAGGATPASVYWFTGRVHLRLDLLPKRKLNAFLVVGGGADISASTARKTFNSGVIGEGYVGAGVLFDTQKGFLVRFDTRFAGIPSATKTIAFEGDFMVGIEFLIGAPKKETKSEVVVQGPPPDKDDDGIADADDKCIDRAEDSDNVEDGDGCPDIDNDGDHVLDIADKCAGEQETFNGFNDDDGCADSVPAEVDALRGTVEGLIYAEGETVVRDSAQKNMAAIAKVMAANPSLKIVLVGHTDDREAKAFAETPKEGEPPPDIDSIATDLARARAEAVRQALVAQGVPAGRVVVDGVGAEEPVADNNSAKGRLANRRVELKLFVPKY
ncbi:MAG TPA: OmpA family protein [Kofleriaceae bacterium]|nr:OmpA family protein [Kofleriaceae bacterium]